MKQKITTEHSLSLYDLDGMTIDEIIEHLREFKHTLADKGLLNGRYEFYTWGDCEVDSKFSLTREETEQEYNDRIRKENEASENYRKQMEAKEQAEYLRLKAKYEP